VANILLVYDVIERESSSWIHLLQQQAIYDSARAVLASHGDRGPQLSEHTLIAPAHVDVLPILAITARDYAEFTEPEGERRPSRIPITLYADPSWNFAGTSRLLMATLLHPSWFEVPVSLREIVQRYAPEICIAAGDPTSIAKRLWDLDHRFRQALIFESLMRDGDEMPEMPGRLVRVERVIKDRAEQHISKLGDQAARNDVWNSMIRHRELIDLEPFFPFGLAIELAIRGE
jgi:hypothetical protein